MPVERSGQLEPLDRMNDQAQRLLRDLPGPYQVGRHPRGAGQVERGKPAPLQLRVRPLGT
jgi:hypothetical protein